MVSGFTLAAIGKWAKANLTPQTTVLSDGLGCFAAVAVADAGCMHVPMVVGALKPRDLPQFMWVNTVLGNLKTTLAGAFHALKYNKYAEHYLAAFSYRFNRRFDLRGLIARLIVDVARCKPIKEEVVRAHAEAVSLKKQSRFGLIHAAADDGATVNPRSAARRFRAAMRLLAACFASPMSALPPAPPSPPPRAVRCRRRG